MNINLPPLHRSWVLVLIAALFLLAAGRPLAQWGLGQAQARAGAIAGQRKQMEQAERQFRDDLQMAQSPEGHIGAEDVDRLLAPVDRLRVTAGLERQAASAGLSNFTYALAPALKAKVDIVEADDMIESGLTIEADLPLDADAAAFIRHLNFALPGRVRLRKLDLTRKDDAALSLANLHMAAELEWLSNGESTESGAP